MTNSTNSTNKYLESIDVSESTPTSLLMQFRDWCNNTVTSIVTNITTAYEADVNSLNTDHTKNLGDLVVQRSEAMDAVEAKKGDFNKALTLLESLIEKDAVDQAAAAAAATEAAATNETETSFEEATTTEESEKVAGEVPTTLSDAA